MDLEDLPQPERETVAPTELSTDDANPNAMGQRQYEALKENIKKFGFVVPVIVNRNYLVADGEHRLRAAHDLGLSEIPVVKLDIDDPDRRILRQVLNKLTGDHDIHQDAYEYQRILESREKSDISDLLGQSERSIDGVLEMLDSNDATDETLADISGPSNPSGSETATDGAGTESLGSPDALDPDTMEFDHECPQCGYEFD